MSSSVAQVKLTYNPLTLASQIAESLEVCPWEYGSVSLCLSYIFNSPLFYITPKKKIPTFDSTEEGLEILTLAQCNTVLQASSFPSVCISSMLSPSPSLCFWLRGYIHCVCDFYDSCYPHFTWLSENFRSHCHTGVFSGFLQCAFTCLVFVFPY